jgi:hypothetical protein
MPYFKILDYMTDLPWGTVVRAGVQTPDHPPPEAV